MGITLSNVKDIKTIKEILVENITEVNYESDDENIPRCIEAEQITDLQQTLNSIDVFLMLLVISNVVS